MENDENLSFWLEDVGLIEDDIIATSWTAVKGQRSSKSITIKMIRHGAEKMFSSIIRDQL